MRWRKPVITIGRIKIRFLITLMIIILMPECVSRQHTDYGRSGSDVTYQPYCKNLATRLLFPKVLKDFPSEKTKGSNSFYGIFPLPNSVWNKIAFPLQEKVELKTLKECKALSDISMTIHVAILILCLLHVFRIQYGMQQFTEAFLNSFYGKNETTKTQMSMLTITDLKAMLEDVLYHEAKKSKNGSIFDRLLGKSVYKAHGGLEHTVMTLFQNEMQRIASYRTTPNLNIPDSVSVLKLANAGFVYSGVGSHVTCTECNTQVELTRFYGEEPTNSRFHAPGCHKAGLNDELIPTHTDRLKLSAPEVYSQKKSLEVYVTFPFDNTCAGAVRPKTVEPRVHPELKVDGVSASVIPYSRAGECYVAEPAEDDSLGSTPNRESSASIIVQDQTSLEALEGSAVTTSENQNGATSSQNAADLSNFLDDVCDPEHCVLTSNDPSNKLDIHRSTCLKNPGHYAYFPLAKLKQEHLPSAARCPEFSQFISLFGLLTVRVKVLLTSRKGPESSKDQQFKVGTGWVSLNHQTTNPSPQQEAEHSKLNSLRRYVSTFVKKEKHLVFIETNSHVVESDEEARNTMVEFFYDDPSGRGVKTVKGFRVIHSGVAGDNQSVLVCKTSDQALVQHINRVRLDLLDIKERLPKRTKESMTKKLYIIGHPHGKEKVLSYGDSVPVKYAINRGDNVGHRLKMIKVNNSHEVSASPANMRKGILYAADTCIGSSGAPIIGFTKEWSSVTGQSELKMTVWMHDGAEKEHSLGLSVLKECTKDDLQRFMSHDGQQNSGALDDSEDSEDDQSPGNQQVSSPVFKVLTHTSYPSYIEHAKRLGSFAEWTYGHIHTAEDLAAAGFFYAGYADCVRCFQCGLGLRSWKPGDDIYTEHGKHRPNCPFLLTLLSKGTGSRAISQQDKPEPLAQQPTNALMSVLPCNELNSAQGIFGLVSEQVKLLARENTILRQQLQCKVCGKAPIRDLFLPCGELYACSECSKLLTHCPSCKKQILATVTTYFT